MANYQLNQPGATIQEAIDIALRIQTDLSSETAAREAADALLASKTELQAEAARAQAAEALLATITSLNSEIARATGVEDALQSLIDAIEERIPSAASASNQLADKAFVNSSIATATAEFRGTYNSLAELQAVSADDNDYGYVRTTDAAGNTVFKRYKYASGSWVFEYDLNNSSFTASQWAAINSAVTAELVAKLSALPDNATLTAALAAKQDVIEDLSSIRSKANSAYQKPSGGIPASDIADGVIPDVSGKVNTSDIADNLTTNDATKVLSAKQGKVLNENLTQLDQKVTELDEEVNGGSEQEYVQIDLSQLAEYRSFVTSTQKWGSGSNYTSVFKSITPGEKYKLTAKGVNGTYFAILQDNTHTDGQSPTFATGETGRRSLATGTSYEFTAPSDANYICITLIYNGTDRSADFFQEETIVQPSLEERILNEVSEALKPEINLPSKLIAVVGKEFNIYKDNMLVDCTTDDICLVDSNIVNSTKDTAYETKKRIRWTPTTASDDQRKFDIYARSMNTISETIGVQVLALSESVLSGKTINYIVIGDSKVHGGWIPRQIALNIAAAGGSFNCLGTIQNVLSSTTNYNHEGRPGWSAYNYTHLASVGDYTNAFWNPGTSEFDFSYYMTQQGYEGVDVVFINLGTNDVGQDKAEEFVDNITEMITSIKSYDSNIKVVVGITEPSSIDLVGSFLWQGYKIKKLDTEIISSFDNRENEGIYVCPLYLSLDPSEDYTFSELPLSAADVARETGKTTKIVMGTSGTNQVHQSPVGYLKNAEAMYAILVYIEQ